ncbi:META domain-containing protein [Ornithobacterium rhinotracheale]|uniref:META domain-containing protein n=1 Tax=Ornithobacterium rhinotracheale TaxID=28251 RepID=UPI0040361025
MKTKILFFSLIIGLFALTTACNNDDDPKPPTELIGQWKCLGFGNTNGIFRKISPNEEGCEKCYTIDFRDNYEFFVKSSYNSMSGVFVVKNSSLQFKKIIMTDVYEEGDGTPYTESLKKISHYKIEKGNLQLFYSDTEYLLFKPLKN